MFRCICFQYIIMRYILNIINVFWHYFSLIFIQQLNALTLHNICSVFCRRVERRKCWKFFSKGVKNFIENVGYLKIEIFRIKKWIMVSENECIDRGFPLNSNWSAFKSCPRIVWFCYTNRSLQTFFVSHI